MKQSPSITTAIKKINQLFEMVKRIDEFLNRKPVESRLVVTFSHDITRKLISTRWSDQYYLSNDRDIEKESVYKYSYAVESKGIHFTCYEKGTNKDYGWFKAEHYWHCQSDQNSISLLSIPNIPPPDFKGTMYTFHQEKIKETLSTLPAWAMVCGVD